MRTRSSMAAAGVGLLLSVTPVWAHHAFTAEFDADKPVTLEGPVTKVEWVNPHAWIYVDATGPDGSADTWMIEVGSPNVLLRRGFSKDLLPIGTLVRVRGFAVKDGSHKANGGDLTLPDGRTILVGSLGTGAPYDEKKK